MNKAHHERAHRHAARGYFIDLPGRGTHFYRRGTSTHKPPLLLLHGMLASSALNWARVFEPLSAHFDVIAPDLRGHGRSARTLGRFTLDRCVDDIASLHEELGLGPMIVGGYSMGGAVAQRLWRRHPERIAGLVLSACGSRPRAGVREQMLLVPFFALVVTVTRISEVFSHLPQRLVERWVRDMPEAEQKSELRWALDEMRRNSVRVVVESAREMAFHDSSEWLTAIDVPTAVLVTLRDRAVPKSHQLELARRIAGAEVFGHDGGHASCGKPEFGALFTEVCCSVAARVDGAERGIES